jgi:hypothetical protein
MARHSGPVLVDTNAILESFRVGAWRALSGGYGVETVEECITETQTGYQRRQPEQQINGAELRSSLVSVHSVGDPELARVAVSAPDIALDLGERCLWAHALARADAWVLCGPDKASLRFGVRLGFRDRLVALEWLLDAVGHRPRLGLRPAYTSKWLEKTLGELFIAERRGGS